MVRTDIDKWVDKNGKDFLKEVGIEEGYTVLDFGCGEGHYTIPAAEIVGHIGKVYALDKDFEVLNKLGRIIEARGIDNVFLLNEDIDIPLQENSIDVTLCYDVLHYMNKYKRKKTYREVYRVLKNGAIFSVYPKHLKNNSPSGELANITLREIIQEIENDGFKFKSKFYTKLLHYNHYDRDYILNFKRRRN